MVKSALLRWRWGNTPYIDFAGRKFAYSYDHLVMRPDHKVSASLCKGSWAVPADSRVVMTKTLRHLIFFAYRTHHFAGSLMQQLRIHLYLCRVKFLAWLIINHMHLLSAAMSRCTSKWRGVLCRFIRRCRVLKQDMRPFCLPSGCNDTLALNHWLTPYLSWWLI